MIVKVADFGFSENLYTRAYVRIRVNGRVRLPVKWMAPESILDRVFSEKTDVVCCYISFAAIAYKLAYSYTHIKSISVYVYVSV